MNLPPHVYLEITRACNQTCPFCSCVWLEHGKTMRPELSVNEWKLAVEELIANGVCCVSVTGGEPTLKPGAMELFRHLAELLKKYHPEKHRLALFSNGKAVCPNWFDLLNECGAELYTSLPGLRTFAVQTHEPSDGFRRVLQFIHDASEHGIRVSTGVTVTKQNPDELYEIFSYAVLSGAKSVILNLFKPSGRGAEHPELLLSESDIRLAVKTADEVAEKCGPGFLFSGEFPEFIRQEEFPHIHVENRCAAVQGTFTVAPDGWLHVCEHEPEGLCPWYDWKTLETNQKWQFFALSPQSVCPLFHS